MIICMRIVNDQLYKMQYGQWFGCQYTACVKKFRSECRKRPKTDLFSKKKSTYRSDYLNRMKETTTNAGRVWWVRKAGLGIPKCVQYTMTNERDLWALPYNHHMSVVNIISVRCRVKPKLTSCTQQCCRRPFNCLIAGDFCEKSLEIKASTRLKMPNKTTQDKVTVFTGVQWVCVCVSADV